MNAEDMVAMFKKYHDDYPRYAHDILDFEVDPDQAKVLKAISKRDRVACCAGNGWGKGVCDGVAALAYFDTHYGAKVPVTSGSFRQVKRTVWSEIHALAQRSKLKSTYNLLNTDLERIGHEQTWFITGFTADSPELAEGWHGKNIMFIVDEARAVPDDMWQAIFRGCTTPGAKILATSIPGEASGQFYRICTGMFNTWKVFTFPTAAFKYGSYRAIYPDRVSQISIDEKLADLGESSPFFQTSVLARFASTAEDALIPMNLIQKARENALDPKGAGITWGGDVARYGRDTSCMCKRQGPCVLDFRQKKNMDTVSVATWFEIEAQGNPLCVDEIGVGSGVIDTLRARQVKGVVAVNVSQAARDSEKHLNKRAEEFWALRTRFERGEIDLTHLPRDTYERLAAQLGSIRYKFSKGKLQIESKDDMRKRGPSPDMADSLMLSYAAEAHTQWFTPVLYPSTAGSMLGKGWEDRTPEEPDYKVKSLRERALEKAGQATGLWSSTGEGTGGMPDDGIW